MEEAEDSSTGVYKLAPNYTMPRPRAFASTATKEDRHHVRRLQVDNILPLLPIQSPFKRQGRLLDLPILIEQREHLAIPDTGSSINAISYAALSELNLQEVIALEDDLARPDSCKLADRRMIEAVGQIWLRCAFPEAHGHEEVRDVLFRVYSKLAMGVSVILGNMFLDATETLTKYTNRLKPRSLSLGHHPPRVMRLGPLASYMHIYINSLRTHAYADTGSEIDLISLDYAVRREFKIHNVFGDERLIVFADGELGYLYGKVSIRVDLPPPQKTIQPESEALDHDDIDLAKNIAQPTVSLNGPQDEAQLRDFYVFDGLDCDVLLGQVFLDAIDAFKSHPEAFIHIEDEEHKQQMCGIFKFSRLHHVWKRRGGSHGESATSSVPGKVSRSLDSCVPKLTPCIATEDELYLRIDEIDQCKIARRDKAEAEIERCKADYAQESDSPRKDEIRTRERELIAANRDLCIRYEKEKADLLSAFHNANMVVTLPIATPTPPPQTVGRTSQAASLPQGS